MWTTLTTVLCLSSVAVAQLVTHTNGSSGDPCPSKRCLRNVADCVNGTTCVCRSPFVLDIDNGKIGCYRNNSVPGEVSQDPTVRNLNDEYADFPFPCRYLLTSVTTNLRINRRNVGFCYCQLYGFNEKYRGKIFIGGFDFACSVTNNDLNQTIGFSSRIYGQAENGVYVYTELGANEFLPNGPWSNIPVDVTGAGINVKSSYDLVNNQAKLSVLECGFSISLVGYDVLATKDQEQVSGLAYSVNCALGPRFDEDDITIATAPIRLGGTGPFANIVVPPLTVTQSLLIRGFTANVVQNQPEVAPQCETVGTFLNQCNTTTRAQAAQGCFWILNEARLLRCLDRGTDFGPVLNLIQQCISFYCSGALTCSDFVNIVGATGCLGVRDIPELAAIADPGFCSGF